MNTSPLLRKYNDSFTMEAYFSSNPVDDIINEINGSLTFSPNEKVLSIHVSLEDLKFWNRNHIDYVYGISPDGIYLKLTNLINMNSKGNVKTNQFLCTFYVNTCTLSELPFKLSNNTRKIDFSLTGFNTWFPIFEKRKVDYLKRGGLKLSVNFASARKIGSFTCNNKKLFLQVYTELESPSRIEELYYRDLTVKSRIGCIISGYSHISNTDAIKIVKDFEKLFAVLTGQRQQIVFIRLFSKKNKKAIYTSQITETLSNIKKHIDPTYPFAYKTFEDTLGKVINNFFNRTDNKNALIINYLMSLNKNLDLSNELLDLCQSIDSYYESIPEVSRVLEKRIKTFLNKLPDFIRGILKDNREVILKGFLVKFREGKITTSDLDRSSDNLSYGDTLGIWARCISDTRMFLVHGNLERSKFRIDDSVEKTRNTELLQFLVQCFILQELGYSNFNREELKSAIKRIITNKKYSII